MQSLLVFQIRAGHLRLVRKACRTAESSFWITWMQWLKAIHPAPLQYTPRANMPPLSERGPNRLPRLAVPAVSRLATLKTAEEDRPLPAFPRALVEPAIRLPLVEPAPAQCHCRIKVRATLSQAARRFGIPEGGRGKQRLWLPTHGLRGGQLISSLRRYGKSERISALRAGLPPPRDVSSVLYSTPPACSGSTSYQGSVRAEATKATIGHRRPKDRTAAGDSLQPRKTTSPL